jgi:hypothetical protein
VVGGVLLAGGVAALVEGEEDGALVDGPSCASWSRSQALRANAAATAMSSALVIEVPFKSRAGVILEKRI